MTKLPEKLILDKNHLTFSDKQRIAILESRQNLILDYLKEREEEKTVYHHRNPDGSGHGHVGKDPNCKDCLAEFYKKKDQESGEEKEEPFYTAHGEMHMREPKSGVYGWLLYDFAVIN